MKVWYDATESRTGTRLPANVIQFGTRLVGFEAMTGGDILLSPLYLPGVCELDLRGRIDIAVHCRAGLLVQRKSGMDLISSLSHLAEIQCRMQKWGSAWLLVTGRFQSKNGVAVVNGRKSVAGYAQMISALDFWQLRGGGVSVLDSDDEIGGWIQVMLKRLKELESNSVKEVIIGVNRQKLTQANLATKEQASISTLSTFPGISHVMAQKITRALGGRLGEVIVRLSNGDKVTGVGVKTVSNVRDWLGLKDNEDLNITRRKT